MKYLYKYPQQEYPYRELIETNRSRSREEFEYELLDTGIFDDDATSTFLSNTPRRAGRRAHPYHRAQSRPESAACGLADTLVPQHWSWGEDDRKPSLREVGPGAIQATHHELGEYWFYCEGGPELLFTENETNAQCLWASPMLRPT